MSAILRGYVSCCCCRIPLYHYQDRRNTGVVISTSTYEEYHWGKTSFTGLKIRRYCYVQKKKGIPRNFTLSKLFWNLSTALVLKFVKLEIVHRLPYHMTLTCRLYIRWKKRCSPEQNMKQQFLCSSLWWNFLDDIMAIHEETSRFHKKKPQRVIKRLWKG